MVREGLGKPRKVSERRYGTSSSLGRCPIGGGEKEEEEEGEKEKEGEEEEGEEEKGKN